MSVDCSRILCKIYDYALPLLFHLLFFLFATILSVFVLMTGALCFALIWPDLVDIIFCVGVRSLNGRDSYNCSQGCLSLLLSHRKQQLYQINHLPNKRKRLPLESGQNNFGKQDDGIAGLLVDLRLGLCDNANFVHVTRVATTLYPHI